MYIYVYIYPLFDSIYIYTYIDIHISPLCLYIYINSKRGYIYITIYMYIWSTQEKTQLFASSNGNCNKLTHLKIWTTQEKMQLFASSNGNCNRSTDLNFRSRASRGVSRQQVHVRRRRHVNTWKHHNKFRSSPLQFTRRSRTQSDKKSRKRKGN